MGWFRNLTIGTKLTLGFSLILVLLATVAFVGNRVNELIYTDLEEVFTDTLPSVDHLLQIDRDLQQLLVAERSMVFADTRSDLFKQLVQDYDENLQQSQERWSKFKALPKTPEELTIISEYDKARAEWQGISQQVVDGRKADTREGRRLALDLTLGAANEKFETMRAFLDQLQEIAVTRAESDYNASSALKRKATIFLVGFAGLSILIGILLSWGISRGIGKSLKSVIRSLAESSQQVAAASAQVASASQSLAEGSSEQAASLEETSSSLEEMASMTRQNANNAREADQLMKQTNEVVQRANSSMSELGASMEEIHRASEETSKIIKTIDEIAFQTNLLALNAAVEAARAGEAGAGFAVVADEVRNLAMRAADAARNTADLIEGTVKKVKGGAELMTRTGADFSEVTQSSVKVAQLVGEIAAASTEQAQGVDQVNLAVSEMDKVTQQNAANAEESASASAEMNAQAEHMKVYMSQLEALVGRSSDRHVKAAKMEQGNKLRPSGPAHPEKRARRGNGKDHEAAARVARRKALPVHATQEVRPEQVIPLDENDFKDF